MPKQTPKKPAPAAKKARAAGTKSSSLNYIGSLIARLRDDRHMTQTELARKIGTTQSVVARIEKGEQNLSTKTLAKISEALDKEILAVSSGALNGTVNFRIEGGHKLSGAITVRTSKNGAVGVMCASLLNKGTTIIKNAPKIEEVYRIAEVLQSIGVSVKWIDGDKGKKEKTDPTAPAENDLEIKPPREFSIEKFDIVAAAKTRSFIMMIGPLIHYLKTFSIPQSGGCRLGSRTVKPYFYALERLGITISTTTDRFNISRSTKNGALTPAEIVLYEAGDGVTECALTAAALIPGKTVIKFASANYQVQDVCFYLELLGVKIDGIGTSTLTVHGIGSIDTNVSYYVAEDPIEAMSLIAAAIVTKSSITIERSPIDFLELEILKLEKMGFNYKVSEKYKSENGKTNLVDITTHPSTLKALEEKIHSLPYPGINADNLPFLALIATQAEGETLIHDWMYEERAIYYKELDKMRARTVLADPHRIFIKGPTIFKATEMICPPALRPSVIIMLAMLAAEGTSVLRNVYNINRGYEDLAERLNKIGAHIETFRDL